MRYFTSELFSWIDQMDSMAKNIPKISEVKLSSCGLQKKLRLRNCRVAVVGQHFFKKSCGIAITEVLPSSCGIAIADSKIVARAHLCCLLEGRVSGTGHWTSNSEKMEHPRKCPKRQIPRLSPQIGRIHPAQKYNDDILFADLHIIFAYSWHMPFVNTSIIYEIGFTNIHLKYNTATQWK